VSAQKTHTANAKGKSKSLSKKTKDEVASERDKVVGETRSLLSIDA
jgi:hypothetical protein